MIDVDAPLRPHFFQVPVAQWVRQVPTNTRQDDVLFETMAFAVHHAGSQVEDGVGASLTEIESSQLTQQNRNFNRGEEWLQELHEILASTLIFCAGLHVLAAITMSYFEHTNLIGAMVTGVKARSRPMSLR
jgi:cytochrome b